MSETMMKVMFADEICEIPCEEKNGIYYPKADSYGRKDMSILALKALDLMAELDRTVLQCINMSGLYRTIWEEIARKAEVEFDVMDVSFIGQLGHNSLTDTTMVMDQEKPADSVPNTFVPGRNLFFLSIAAVYARERGINHLVTGVSQTDFSGYPDCRDAFIKSLNVTLNLAMDEQFVIHTPLMWIDKAETWALADELGVLELIRTETLTCYNGVQGDGCGHCPACTLRREGLEKYLKSKNQ